MSKKYLYLVFTLYTFQCIAQGIHFSQFNENPSLVNPALTGVAYAIRGSICYRDQWRSVTTPYKTFGVSFETRLNNNSWQQVDKFRTMTFKERGVGRLAWGLSVYGDKAGSGNLASTQGNLSLATFVPVSKKSFISLGLQGSFIQRKLDNEKLLFPSQYNGSTYDPNLPQHEKMTALQYNYFSFSGGALWSYGQESKRIATNRYFKAKFGAAFYRLAAPHSTYFSNKETLLMKYVVHGDLLYSPANFNSAIVPSFLFQVQGSSTEMIAGAILKYYLFNNSKYTGYVKRSSIGYGGYIRNKDAIIFSLNFEKEEQYVIGISYDFNTSKLVSATAGRGSMEITLRYTPPKAFLYQKKVVPK